MNKILLLRFYEKGSVRKKLFMAFCLTLFVSSQALAQRMVTGTVTSSEDDAGMPGVNILVKGTTTGTVTDANGAFSIDVPDENSVLVFSSIGFLTEEITVANQSTISLTMYLDITSLSEIVVIGYGTQDRRDLTGAISSVSSDQIAAVPVATIDQALQGRSPGVQVTSNDGSPGAGISVKIRGIGTFGNNNPLYVVDGYPLSGGLNSINPNDIETIDVLKDASATAIYGSRAANGVVIITTKRGAKDGLQIFFDATTAIQQQPKTYDVLNAEQFATFATEIAAQESYPVLPEWSNPSSLRNINWQDEIYQNGLRQNYNLGVRGGGDKINSSFSVGYFNHDGIVRESYFTRYNTSLNVDYTPNNWFKAAVSIKYARTNSDNPFGTGITGLALLPRQIPTMTGNPLTDQVKDADGNYGYYTKGEAAVSGYTNLVASLEERDAKNDNDNLIASGYIELTVIKGLKLKSNVGINTSSYSGYSFTPSNQRVEPAAQAFYSQSSNNTFEWLWENTAAYSKTFGDHTIDVVAGVSAQENTFRQIGGQGTGLVNNDLRNLGSVQSISNLFGNQETWSLASLFGRVSYKLMDKYMLTATVRRDGSSRFGSGNLYGVFPSVAAAWRIKDEQFMEDVNFISDLKLRGSWGQTGNQNIGSFGYQAAYNTGTSLQDNRGYVFGSPKTYVEGVALSQLPNPFIKWETTTQSNIGIDAAFIQGKITLSVDYYSKVSEDFLLDVPIPGQTGFSTQKRNVGSVENKGLEVSLGYRESEGDFRWGISANITTLNNKIISFVDGLESVPNLADLGFPNYGGNIWSTFGQSRVGGNIGAFYGFVSDGIIQSQAEIDALNQAAATATGTPGTFYQTSATAPGDRKFKDLNDDGVITDDDRQIIGSPIPDFYGGLNIDASYKNFDFSMFWYASVGNEILNYAKRNLMSLSPDGGVGVQNVSTEFYNNRWTETNPSTIYPRAVRDDKSGNGRVSDAFIEDGSFVRLRNIQIGYTFPKSLTDKIAVNKLRVYVSAQNLFTITNYSGLDPEIGENRDPNSATNPSGATNVTASGVDIGVYPQSKFYTLGLNVQF